MVQGLAVLGLLSVVSNVAAAQADGWADGLLNRDAKARRQALVALAAEGTAQQAREAAALLDDVDAGVRDQAAQTFAILTAKDDVRKLMSLFRHDHPRVRENAALVFGLRGEQDEKWKITWRFALGRLLEDGDAAVRARAAWALSKTGVRGHVVQTLPLLKSESVAVRIVAFQALWLMGPTGVSYGLKDRDAEVRASTADMLARLGAREYATEVVPLLKDRATPVRLAACMALGSFGAKEHAGSLRPLAQDDDLGVRSMASWAIERLESTEAAPAPTGSR